MPDKNQNAMNRLLIRLVISEISAVSLTILVCRVSILVVGEIDASRIDADAAIQDNGVEVRNKNSILVDKIWLCQCCHCRLSTIKFMI